MSINIGRAYIIVVLVVVTIVGSLTPSNAERQGRTDRAEPGGLCVPEPQVNGAISAIRSFGGKARRFPDNDGVCTQAVRSNMVALEIPSGLEGWTLDRLRAQGFTARYMFGTAGGGLDSRARLDPKILFDRQPTPTHPLSVNCAHDYRSTLRMYQHSTRALPIWSQTSYAGECGWAAILRIQGALMVLSSE